MKIKKTLLILGIIIGLLIIIEGYYFIYLRKRPNILLITVDALRPDHLGCYGYKRDTSPNIDSIAKDGIIFTQAIAQGASTIPSLPSLMYSRYFKTSEVKPTINRIKNTKLPILSLQEILRANGYFTIFACAHSAIPQIKAVLKGWDKIFEFDDIKPHAQLVTNKIVRWLKEYGGKLWRKPFFLWIHYMDTHTPYVLPLYYKAKFCWDELFYPPYPIKILDRPPWLGGIPLAFIEYNITDFRYYIAQYDGAINFVDDYIGFIMDYLKENNLYNNTLIIISSDHGEAMGEHNFFLVHSLHLYDEFIRVPLIMKLPKNLKEGKRIQNQVQLIDVAPTILHITGINKIDSMQGESLLPLILKDEGRKREYAFSNTGTLCCIRTPKYKLIFHKDKNFYELYDLEKDPGELKNLIDTGAYNEELFNIFKQELDIWLNQKSFYSFVEDSSLKELKRELKNLGYME